MSVTVQITFTPDAESADASDETGLTQEAYEAFTEFLKGFAEDFDIEAVRPDLGATT